MKDCKVDRGTYVSLRIKSFADANKLATAIAEEIPDEELPFSGMAWLMEFEGRPWFAIRIATQNADAQLDAIGRAIDLSGVEVLERLNCRLDQVGQNVGCKASTLMTRWEFSNRAVDDTGVCNG